MSDLAQALATITGPNVSIAVEPVTDAHGLEPAEAVSVASAIPTRQAEFAAGRRAVRAALTDLGHRVASVPILPDRSPDWPDGIVGSITHDADIALAAVGYSTVIRAMGIDLTDATEFPSDLRSEVLCTRTERSLNGLQARAVFAAKEALFKALHSEVGFFFGFETVEIDPNAGLTRFGARLRQNLGSISEGTHLTGRLAVSDKKLLAALVLPIH